MMDQRNTIEWCPWVTASYFIKCSHSTALLFLHFNSDAQNWTKFTFFTSSQVNIIISFDQLSYPFPCLNEPTNLKTQSNWSYFPYVLTQCIGLYNYEAQQWPKIRPQHLDSLGLILDSVIKLLKKLPNAYEIWEGLRNW